eukprot:1970130-Pyramimonas_sp.AAC.1
MHCARHVGWAGGCEVGQTGLHGGCMGDHWRGGRAAPGASPTSKVPGAQDAAQAKRGVYPTESDRQRRHVGCARVRRGTGSTFVLCASR